MGNRSRQAKAKKQTANKQSPLQVKTRNQTTNNQVSMAQEKPKLDMLLLHLPTFDGRKENNITFYMQQFEDLAKDLNLTEAQKLTILKAKFSGPARETLINNPELYQAENLDELKLKLKHEFQSKKSLEEIGSEFKTLKQRPEQTIDEFAKVFQMKSLKYIQKLGHAEHKDAVEFFNKLKLQEFLNMIRQDIAFEVRKSAPKSLDDAITLAKQIEAAQKFIPGLEDINNAAKLNRLENETLLNITTSQMTELQELRKQFEEFKVNKIEKPKSQAEKFCGICDSNTHTLEECFYNLKSNSNKKKYSKSNFKQEKRFQKPNMYNNIPNYMYQPNIMQAGPSQPNNYYGQGAYGGIPNMYFTPFNHQQAPRYTENHDSEFFNTGNNPYHNVRQNFNQRNNRNFQGNDQNKRNGSNEKSYNSKQNYYRKNQGN